MTVGSIHMIISRELKAGAHPGDLLELLEELKAEEKAGVLERLSETEALVIFQELEDYEQAELLRWLSDEKASQLIGNLASDDAADLFGELPPDEAREMLTRIDPGESIELSDLLKYPEESAGGIMTTEYIYIPADITVDEALGRLREIAPGAETVYYVYVVDETGRLSGVLSLRDLIVSAAGTLISEVMRTNVISVNADLDQEEVARAVSKYDLLAVPVVDSERKLLGIITVDDVIDVLEQEATEDIYRLAGAGEIEGVELTGAKVGRIVRMRLPWLLVSMIGGVISGSVIGAFENTLEAIVMLAIFIPMVMGMGGNVGTQSSTIYVRGLATGEIDKEREWTYFFREVQIGAIMGAVCGLAIALIALFWQGNPYLGLVVGLSMFSTISTAAILGTVVPMACNKLKIDPAITAGPFVTMIKDVTGLLIYFVIASTFLEYLR